MTTTAEKIEALELLIKEEESKKLPRGWLIALLDDDKRELEESLKMFDPEPLEYWVNVDGDETSRTNPPTYRFHHTKEEAESGAEAITTRVAVHIREVTPLGRKRSEQIEQDRKDAATLRKLKQLSTEDAMAVVECPLELWEKQIDTWIERGD